MIITDLELLNFRKHKRLRLKFKAGITGIVGDNGSGKSSIVEAILFALTGLLFSGTKDDALSLGEDSGSVTLKFLLNGKSGTITRFLPESKVTLSYGGGVPLKKAGDIKELWDKLLQVGPEIISKVIIAQQGHIPLLFSGDSSIREKIFQKIFLVPNTEKIRGAITKNYLKQLPPLLAIEDTTVLTTSIENVEKEIAILEEELSNIDFLSEVEVDDYKARLQFLVKCENDAGSKIILDENYNIEMRSYDKIATEAAELKLLLKSINISDYEKQRSILLQQKSLYLQKIKLQEQLAENELQDIDEQGIREAKERYEEQSKVESKLSDDLLRLKIGIESNRKQVDKFKQLRGQALCFTCNQPLHSVVELLKLLEDEVANDTKAYGILKKQQLDAEHLENQCEDRYLELKKVLESRNQLKETLEQFKDISFNEEDLVTYTEVIDTYRSYEKDLAAVQLKLSAAKGRINMLQKEIELLAVYDGAPEDLYEEKNQIAETLSCNTENIRIIQAKKVDLRMKQYALSDLVKRMEHSKENQEKNKKRNRYAELLNLANDALQMSNFPRKLILNYADVVSDYLQEKLQDFNMPYTARVADNFKIEMYDNEGRRLPKVSGGQEIQVGIALHLALHELFSQSFPLLVIDEGTTHLDTTNRKAYFDIIKKLKEGDKLKQIIIIDHDIQLSEVVDDVIELK